MKVMKFGGTSVGSTDSLQRVVQITKAAVSTHRLTLVVSAASGVTDRLAEALDVLAQHPAQETNVLAYLYVRYRALACEVLRPEGQLRYLVAVEPRLRSLRTTLQAIADEGVTPPLRDEVLAVGERLSAPLVALALCDAGLVALPVDANALIATDDTHGAAVVDLPETQRRIRSWHALQDARTVPVVTGYIGATVTGQTTTLGRGGSDYSAALVAAALQAGVLERWTDVDGLYTDDPRQNEQAERVPRLVLREAQAWNQAGRLGMHRKALDPLVAAGIPVHVRSTLTPDQPGTFILPEDHEQLGLAVGY